MMGCSPYMKRSELLRLKAGGEPSEVSQQQQSAFDAGHDAEVGGRAIAEQIIGQELYPCTAVSDCGQYLASFDGLTMLGDTVFEHKLLSQALFGIIESGELTDAYRWQVDHQFMVSGADRALFMASDGETHHEMWVERDEARIAMLIAGWDQFLKDLETYVPPDHAPAVVGVAPETLPALRIELTGMVTASNLPQFTAQALAVFDGIKTDLATDDDFADAEKTVGWCKDIEGRLDAAKQHALSQTASIDELFRAIDDIKERARAKRLTLEKLVKSRKDDIRSGILRNAKQAIADHHNRLRERLGLSGPFPSQLAPFEEAMKNKRTIASLQDAVDTVLSHAKIAANETADRMDANLKTLRGSSYASLFPDAEGLAVKEPADLAQIMRGRIAKANEEADRRAEEARERIRREEAAKAQADAEQLAAEDRERVKGEEAANVQPAAPEAQAPRVIAKRASLRAPTADEIVAVLSRHYRVDAQTVIAWLEEAGFRRA